MLFPAARCSCSKLLAAKRDLRLSRQIQRYARTKGSSSTILATSRQTREEMEVVFTLLAERYERGSVLLTSNLPFSKWEGIFKDPMTTAAAIDRLVHHSVIVELNIPSYRLEQARNNGQALGKEPARPTRIPMNQPPAPASPCASGRFIGHAGKCR